MVVLRHTTIEFVKNDPGDAGAVEDPAPTSDHAAWQGIAYLPSVLEGVLSTEFDAYLRRWRLTPDGDAIVTHSSRLLPVRRDGVSAMLKIATEPEERRGAETMVWWGGEGAARVLEHDGEALLMERAMGDASLVEMAQKGHDDEATRIICAAAARLHAPRSQPLPPSLVPLARWFAELEPGAARYGGILRKAAAMARALLGDQRDVVVLHGDIHHGNILDFGPRGWLAIDPKGLLGERTFDFVNLLRNPDDDVALAPGRFARQVSVVAAAAEVDRVRLLRWTLAFTGLSAAWILADGDEPRTDLAVAELALEELESCSRLGSRRQVRDGEPEGSVDSDGVPELW